MPSLDHRRCYPDEPSSKRKITESDIANYLVKRALKRQRSDDSNSNHFVWRKKIERDVSNGCMPPQLLPAEEQRERAREKEAEIETLRRRRDERAVRRAQREEEAALLARERSRAEIQDWEKSEADFEFRQIKLKSEIRLREGRPKPIDFLIKYAEESEGEEAPYMVLEGLSVEETEEVRNEIKKQLSFDGENQKRVRFWEAALVVCDGELGRALAVKEEGHGVHRSVESDVESELKTKSYEELETLQAQIESRMQSGAAKVVEYWETILKRLCFYKAKAYLKEVHFKRCTAPVVISKEEVARREEEKAGGVEEAEDGSHSPLLVAIDVDEEEDAVDPEQDRAILEKKRAAVFQRVRATEEGIEHDKYRPRKPKFHTRVHSGYEWNKYNRTHYDHDNPPPKTVLGYKINIFYPDLLDKSRAPGYSIERDGESDQTCIIRFHAGPPYEDIAFRIVNKEWEYSRKKGFKCSFERGILQLHFNFKRYRYRR